MKIIRLGETLVEGGQLTQQQLNAALAYQREHREQPIGRILVEQGFATNRQVAEALAKCLHLPLIDFGQEQVDLAAVELLPQELAEQYGVIAVRRSGQKLAVATADPLDDRAREEIRRVTGLEPELLLSEEAPLRRSIAYYYARLRAQRMARGAAAGAALPQVLAQGEDSPAIRLLDELLQHAATHAVSDIHIEPFETETAVRMRVDGCLLPYATLPRAAHAPLLARIKLLAGLDIAEHRLPQDGHLRMAAQGGGPLNLRVSVLPTLFGEKAVLRLLDGSIPIENAQRFGMDEEAYARFAPLLERPNGLLYLTGPTGSGKTTTLYLVLQALARRQINISTVEDPVERSLPHIAQTQINPTAGLTFETGLRAILRQDPDVIMVGETRDRETAAISVRAAITGHMVLSTLHTNDALSAVVRLKDLGVEPYLIAGALGGVVAQRLVRRVCPQCSCPVPPTAAERALLGGELPSVRRGTGCPACGGTGYRGRIALHEIVVMDRELRALVAADAPMEALAESARRTQKLRTLRESALALVRRGETTPEEALKATSYLG